MRISGARAWLPALAVASFAALAVKLVALDMPTARYWDFEVFHAAGGKALAGRTVYDVAGHFQYKYAPWVALFFGVTVSSFDIAAAYSGWFVAMTLAWGAFFALLGRIYRPEVPALMLAPLFFSNYLDHELSLGQVNSVPLLAFALMYLFLGRNSRAWDAAAGALFCIAFSFKLVFLIAGPYLLLRRRWVALGVSGLCFFALNLGWVAWVSGPASAVAELGAWLSTLTQSTLELLTIQGNISLMGMLVLVLEPGPWVHAIWCACGAAFLWLQFQARDRDERFQLAFQCASLVLLSPVSWVNWVLFAAPALALHFEEAEWDRRFVLPAAALGFTFQTLWSATLFGPKTLAIVFLLWTTWQGKGRRPSGLLTLPGQSPTRIPALSPGP